MYYVTALPFTTTVGPRHLRRLETAGMEFDKFMAHLAVDKRKGEQQWEVVYII